MPGILLLRLECLLFHPITSASLEFQSDALYGDCRVSRSSEASQCLQPSVSPDVPVNSAAFDCYDELHQAPEALEGATKECLDLSLIHI